MGKRHFYGFEYISGRHTTEGEVNPRNGRRSIAGSVIIFKTQEKRDAWVEERDYKRIATNKNNLRRLCLGLSVEQFADFIDSLIFELENDYE